jgi:hypothetical protein
MGTNVLDIHMMQTGVLWTCNTGNAILRYDAPSKTWPSPYGGGAVKVEVDQAG